MSGEQFKVTEEHLALLSHAWVSWDDCEFGAPQIDPKRPYGNSDVYRDMAEILGVEWFDEGEDSLAPDVQKRFDRLHAETKTVLQIMLVNGRAKEGTYEHDKYDINWVFIG